MRGGADPGFISGEKLFCSGQYEVTKKDGNPHEENPFNFGPTDWWEGKPELPPNATFIKYDSYNSGGDWEVGTKMAIVRVPIGGNESGTTKVPIVSCKKPTKEQKKQMDLVAEREAAMTGNTPTEEQKLAQSRDWIFPPPGIGK